MTVVSGAFMADGSHTCTLKIHGRSAPLLGTSQTVRFTAPRAGTYIVKLDGASFDGVSLLARQ